jgi:hypothetical protein
VAVKRAVLFLALAIAALWPAAAAATVVETWTHPQASVETCRQVGCDPTRARTIHTLLWFDGKLWSGYGDGVLNTGPTALTPLTPSTDTWGTATSLPTEEISQLRSFNVRGVDTLYVPFTDPIGLSFGGPDYASGVSSFSAVHKFGAAHVFDMAQRPGRNDIWACGSDNDSNDGTVWRSTDGGSTWSQVRAAAPPDPSDPDQYVRFYSCGWVKKVFYALPSSDLPETFMPVHTFKPGVGWSTTAQSSSIHMHDAHSYAGKLVYLDKRLSDNSAPVMSVNSGSITSLGISAEDLSQDGFILYRLSGTAVYSTVDLVNWNVEATAPADATSLEVIGGTVYVGTSESEIHEID